MGKSYEVLISDHEGRHDANRDRVNGRTPDFRLVHLESEQARPGDIAGVTITESSPNFMIGTVNSIRKTRGGDANAARVAEIGDKSIMIGMPTLQKLKTL